MRGVFEWHPYRYFPYERRLGYKELEALTKAKPFFTRSGLIVPLPTKWRKLATKTTYFSRIVPERGNPVIPRQALLELAECRITSSVNGLGLTRQSTRYSAHGIHEYKGKFNPQIVRSVANLLNLKEGDWVFDPFCGCGTTLLEAAHNGWNALGMDLNPLGVLITQAKIASMRISPTALERAVTTINQRLSKRVSNEPRQSQLDDASLSYLSKWFTRPVLDQLTSINYAIDQLEQEQAPLIFRVVLSDLVRGVSLQDPTDLRIRRRKTPLPRTLDVVSLYLKVLERRVKSIVATRRYVTNVKSCQDAMLGDSRECAKYLESHSALRNRKFDAAITSPPYATALPYIDTERLSLILLGLVRPSELANTERELIGSREIGERERVELEAKLTDNDPNLPMSCLRTCRNLLEALDKTSDGFRRRNVPSLLYKYLCDMKAVFGQVKSMVLPHGYFALVVGRNRTRLGGREYLIDTPVFLAEISKQIGFGKVLWEELDTYPRYDRHRLNSIRSEVLLVLSNEG
ncbi:MAG: DNA methyltransferase [Candidatus Bathyarchaeia archaeon]